jgi:DNA processing protein
VRQVIERCEALDITVVTRRCADYPGIMRGLPKAPAVLFMRGNPELVHGRRVAVVGTRNATSSGRAVAAALGRDLAEAGVHVVSGLARGIDGVCHAAMVRHPGAGKPIAVVASGLDVVYPPEHSELWAAVATEGLLMSEAPPGVLPEPYRFPLRNRLIAMLSEAVVVVESRERGGSLITARAAGELGVPVLAVPGAVGNRAALGTNTLLRDGAAVVLDASDVLVALSMSHERTSVRPPSPGCEVGAHGLVFLAVRDEPRTLDGVALVTGMSLVDVATALSDLSANGWVREFEGWYQANEGTP